MRTPDGRVEGDAPNPLGTGSDGSKSTLRSIAEAVGVIGVIASLVFVGVEIRQNAEATRSAMAQQLTDGWLQWNLTMVDSDAWAAVGRLYELEDLSEASFEDRSVAGSLMRAVFQNWSNLHYHYLNGNLDQTLWDSVVRDITVGNSMDWLRLRAWAWEQNRHVYHESFQRLFDSLEAALPAE